MHAMTVLLRCAVLCCAVLRCAALPLVTAPCREVYQHARWFFPKLLLRGEDLPAKVAESGRGYTPSGKGAAWELHSRCGSVPACTHQRGASFKLHE